MYREGKPEQEFTKWNKFMKEKVQEKSKDCIKSIKGIAGSIRLNLGQES